MPDPGLGSVARAVTKLVSALFGLPFQYSSQSLTDIPRVIKR